MFCWQARMRFTGPLENGAADPRLDRHLAACASCRAELEALAGVRALLADAAASFTFTRSGPAPMDDLLFEQTILRKARARQSAKAPQALPQVLQRSPLSFARPVPLGAALSLMLTAVALSYFLGGAGSGLPGGRPAAELAASHDAANLDDSVAPPREVPFVVRQDLVGARRGSIPLTTYVLEPAPREKPILRASL